MKMLRANMLWLLSHWNVLYGDEYQLRPSVITPMTAHSGVLLS